MKAYLDKFRNCEPMTIVCIGDSTTSQEWLHPNWVDWLNFTFRQGGDWERGYLRKIINNGKDGAKIQDYIDGYVREIGAFQPDVVILSLGFNDTGIGSSNEEIETRLSQLMGKIVGSGATLVTWSTYQIIHEKHNRSLKQVRDMYKILTKRYEGIFVDIYQEFGKYDLTKLFTLRCQDENEFWQMKPGEIDYLHTNEIGNQIIAEAIANKVFKIKLLEWPEEFGTMQLMDLEKYR
jgi:lysophospholipase L1-like esterase